MIKIENIILEDGKVSMVVYIEGNRENFFTMVLDAKTGDIVDISRDDTVVFPAHAKQYIMKLLRHGEELPESATVMWV